MLTRAGNRKGQGGAESGQRGRRPRKEGRPWKRTSEEPPGVWGMERADSLTGNWRGPPLAPAGPERESEPGIVPFQPGDNTTPGQERPGSRGMQRTESRLAIGDEPERRPRQNDRPPGEALLGRETGANWRHRRTGRRTGIAGGRISDGKPDEGEPHVRFGEGPLETEQARSQGPISVGTGSKERQRSSRMQVLPQREHLPPRQRSTPHPTAGRGWFGGRRLRRRPGGG
jgi:hypothetical protein